MVVQVLEIKLALPDGQQPPAWVKGMMESGLMTEVHKMSKFIHGGAVLFPEMVQVGCGRGRGCVIRQRQLDPQAHPRLHAAVPGDGALGCEGRGVRLGVGVTSHPTPTARLPPRPPARAPAPTPAPHSHPLTAAGCALLGGRREPAGTPPPTHPHTAAPRPTHTPAQPLLQAVPYWVDDESLRASILASAPEPKQVCLQASDLVERRPRIAMRPIRARLF